MTDYKGYDRIMAKLKADDATAKANRTLVGRYVETSVADGYAYYVITRVSKTLAYLKWVDVLDGYAVVAWGGRNPGGVKLSIIQPMLQQRDAMSSLFAKTDNWWANRTVGEIVHYSNGFGQYVRGVIVREGSEYKMRPTALVGTWASYDLVNRRADGSISYGTYAKGIATNTSETMQPNASNMVEYSNFNLRGAAHPKTMAAIDLTPPRLSPKAEELATLESLRKSVIAALQDVKLTTDASASALTVAKALSAARALLNL